MYDWTQRYRTPDAGPSREALLAALQRARQDYQHLQQQAARELERLQDENHRLRRATSARGPAPDRQALERQQALEGEVGQLRRRLQEAEGESERLYAENARLRAEAEARRSAPRPAAPPPAAAEPAGGEEDRVRRLAADLANVRRRQAEELERARRSARAALVREFVESLDAVEQALQASGEPGSPWHQGIEGVRRQMLATLKGAGVERLGSVGEPFDPRLHEAIGVSPASAGGVAADHIAAVVQAGYRFADTDQADALIRPARVLVAG